MSEAINDGGPAFPVPEHQDQWGAAHAQSPGMSRLDFFAAQAMAVLPPPLERQDAVAMQESHEQWARRCWRMACAMLEAEPK